jgi:hypothetical protein
VCRLDDSGADAAAAAGEADADADEAGDAQGERGTSARDSPRTPSDESQSPYSSSSSAELSLSARRGPQDSALQAMVRLSPLRSALRSYALLRLYRGPDRGGRGLSILTVVPFVTSQVQKSGAAELNLKPERTRLVFGESWLRGSTEMHQAIRYAQTHSNVHHYYESAHYLCRVWCAVCACREKDWNNTALGPQAEWPPTPKTALDLCLTSSFPFVRTLSILA